MSFVSSYRTADVLRRANSRHVEMETDEAREIAEQEVIHILVEEERTIFREEMEKACVDLESRLKEDFAQKENIRKKQQVARAAWSLVSSVRRWQAKKALRLRCIQTFEKVFDDRYQAFYYRNIKTVSTCGQNSFSNLFDFIHLICVMKSLNEFRVKYLGTNLEHLVSLIYQRKREWNLYTQVKFDKHQSNIEIN
jgi:hypothetical protein